MASMNPDDRGKPYLADMYLFKGLSKINSLTKTVINGLV